MPVRPIVSAIGQQGSGKTTLGKRFGRVLYGSDFEVGSFRSDATGEQDFLAAITALRLVVFDNADARIPWLPDHLAKLATGSEIQRRKLYTTNTLASYRPECFLMITSRDPRWKRDDITKRLLPIRMEVIQGANVPENQLKQDIIVRRDLIWRSLLRVLNRIVGELQRDSGTFISNHRLADFHWFGNLASRAVGIEQDFSNAMAHLDDMQFDLLAEGDERLELLAAWIGTKPDTWEQETVTSKDLFDQLHSLHTGHERTFPFRGITGLGTWLGRHKDLITKKLGVVAIPDHAATGRRWSFAKERCQDVTGHKDPAISTLFDSLTPLQQPSDINEALVTGLTEVDLDVG